jgi:hypothetical protein
MGQDPTKCLTELEGSSDEDEFLLADELLSDIFEDFQHESICDETFTEEVYSETVN